MQSKRVWARAPTDDSSGRVLAAGAGDAAFRIRDACVERGPSNISSKKLADTGRHRSSPAGLTGGQSAGRWHYLAVAGRYGADS